jgi:anti-sigma B factor antagonist
MLQTLHSPARLSVAARGPAAVVKLRGSADMFCAGRLRQRLVRLHAARVPLIVFDLSETDFIGSAALSAIIASHLLSREHDGQVRLAGPHPNVVGVLRRTRLDELLAVYPTIEAAVAG